MTFKCPRMQIRSSSNGKSSLQEFGLLKNVITNCQKNIEVIEGMIVSKKLDVFDSDHGWLHGILSDDLSRIGVGLTY